MATNVPIVYNELFQLTNLGIPAQAISYYTVTMESDKFICVRDVSGAQKTINIIETSNQQVTTNKVNADAAIMHPNTKVLALRAQSNLQIFNLEMKARMKQLNMNDNIEFWKWISPSQIALVTSNAVYHWSMQGEDAPKQVFERHANLAGASIINYRTDKNQQWLLLVGLKSGEAGAQGVMQLFSVEKGVTQVIEGHAGCFIDFALTNNYTTTLIAIAANKAAGGQLFIMEVPSAKPDNVPPFQKKALPVQFAPGDFPVAMQASSKHGLLYLITKMGFLYLYEVESGALICKSRINNQTIFLTAPYEPTNGVITVNSVGSVATVSVDERTIVAYVQSLGMQDVAFKIATRANLPGADEMFVAQFNALLNGGQVEEAIKLAADSPHGILRTQATIQKLQKYALPTAKPPLSMYFNYIIQSSSLNKHESVELAMLVLQKPGGVDYIKKLLAEKKLESSDTLGDIVRQFSPEAAMSIYLQAGSHEKIIDTLLVKGEYQKVLKYCEKVNYTPNYLDIFRKLLAYRMEDEAVKLAVEVNGKGLDAGVVVDIFVQAQMFKQATAYLLDILKDNKPEDGPLQTRLLEINLLYSPVQVADSILAQQMFTHYDKKRVAQLCENVALYQRALENYTDINDVKRVIVNTTYINPEFLVNYFGTLEPDDALACLRELMRVNPTQNINIVVQVASKYSEELKPANLIQIFEDFKRYDGLMYYLGAIVDYSKDPDVHFKYIQACARMNNLAEVERVTRESDFYEPEKTKEFLKEVKLQDQMPFINVCDKFGYIEEMVNYLYANNNLKFIDVYVRTRNPLKTPNVVGALLDVDASEEFIKNLIINVGNHCPVEPLVAECEKRNRLKLLLPWLEARINNEGSTEPAAHNALAKIYIDLNNNAEQFLNTNQYYDPRVVGKYCEKRDPYLAFVCYKKGQCDTELVEVTFKNGMYKQQARYLVQRQSPDLWAFVLQDEKNKQFRRQIVDQVVQVALPESNNPEEVSTTVKAFMAAELPNELIELLEQIVLKGNSDFRKNKNLQNLLILTAIKADAKRVMDYINRLDNYDAPDIAQIAVEKGLYEEAFVIYSKFKLHTNAVRVLIEHIADINRASEYAQRVNENEVWSILARAQLNYGMIPQAIAGFLKAGDASAYHEVISAAEKSQNFEDLIKFLKMARGKLQDSHIDTSLVYAYAKYDKLTPSANALADLEDFISSPNTAQIQTVGDRCYDEGLYEAARVLFASISNYSRLASTLVKLGKYREAVSAATKANSIKTWKEVMMACIDAGDFKYAQACGLNIIVQADELDDLIFYYEVRGHVEELIDLLEKGLGLDRVHMGIYTNLGILYAKYKSDKLMDHIQRHYKKNVFHIPKLINACEANHLWAEMRLLYCINEEFDHAIRLMIEHSPEAWDHGAFAETIVKVVNTELYYRAIDFYINEQPKNVLDLLTVLTPKLDHERVARDARNNGTLPLIKQYLENVQHNNLLEVNLAINSLYITEEDYEALRQSIEHHNNFDHVALANQLQAHDLLEFRRIAALLYKWKKNYANSIALSKKDKLYRDAMDTAAESNDPEIAEDLLQFFVDNDLKDCFAACLYTCYSLVRPDVALELSWKHKIQDMAMPFLIQVLREYTSKVDFLHKAHEDEQERRSQVQHHAEAIQPTPVDPYAVPAAGGLPYGAAQVPVVVDPNAAAYGYPSQPTMPYF